MPQRRGLRCYGYLDAAGEYARCTREELAGEIARNADATYSHRLTGDCRCGQPHDQAPSHNGRGPAQSDDLGQPLGKAVPYRVCDLEGNVLALHWRKDFEHGKRMWWTHPDGTTKGLPAGLKPEAMLFGLHQLTKNPNLPVLVVEGEKARMALINAKLRAVVLATVCGAAATPSREVLGCLAGRRVALWPDNDGPGRGHMDRISAILFELGAAELRVVDWPEAPSHGDADDYLAAHSRDEILALLKAAEPWTRPAPSMSVAAVGTLLSDVMPERIDWFWYGRLARGKVSIIDGDPGRGKSVFSIDVAARVSTGTDWPDGLVCPQGGVVLCSAEDGLADTIRPRLDAAGGDSSRVLALDLVPEWIEPRDPGEQGHWADVPLVLPDHLSHVEAAIKRVGAILVVVDPLLAFLSGEVNSHRDQDVRRALRPLKDMAERTGVAVLVIRHMNKSRGGPIVYRGGGSIGIIGAARIGLVVGLDPDNEERHVLALAKKNLTPSLPSLAYRIEDDGHGTAVVRWEGEVDVTAAQVIAGPTEGDSEEDRSALEQARDFLQQLLADGPVESQEVKRASKDAGVAWRTVERAKTLLGVVCKPLGFKQPWVWSLPQSPPKNTESATQKGWRSVDDLADSVAGDEDIIRLPLEEIEPCPRCRRVAGYDEEGATRTCADCGHQWVVVA